MAVRERGWRSDPAGAGLFLLVPAFAALRILFPVEQTMLLVVPAIGVLCARGVGAGGRVWLALTWVVLAAWMLLRPLDSGVRVRVLARGWALVLVSMFGIACLLGGRRFVPVTRACPPWRRRSCSRERVVLVSNVAPGRVQRTLADELDRRAAPLNAQVQATTVSSAMAGLRGEQPTVRRHGRADAGELEQDARLPVSFFPALLALESLAALALAWGLFHRISRTRLGPPLSRCANSASTTSSSGACSSESSSWSSRPSAALRGLGLNLIVFFGALYVLRGLGVLAWFMRRSGAWRSWHPDPPGARCLPPAGRRPRAGPRPRRHLGRLARPCPPATDITFPSESIPWKSFFVSPSRTSGTRATS